MNAEKLINLFEIKKDGLYDYSLDSFNYLINNKKAPGLEN